MNFYDNINNLVSSFKNTEEYTKYLELKELIRKDENTYNKLKQFKDKQSEVQMGYLNGQELSNEVQQEMQNLYSIVIQDDNSRRLLELEMKINIMLADIQKSLGNAVEELVKF